MIRLRVHYKADWLKACSLAAT